MTRLACVIISWLGCAVVIGMAFKALPVPVSIKDVLVIHAQFEETLAKQEGRRDG